MKKSILAAWIAAASLVIAPVAVQAAPATESERATAPTADESDLYGDRSPLLLLLLGIAAIVAAVLLLDGNDDPVSP